MAGRNGSTRQNKGGGSLDTASYRGPGVFGHDNLSARHYFVFGFACLLAIIFVCQLVRITIIDAADREALATATRNTQHTILAQRGTIYDRNGNILATSVKVKSVYCDPLLVSDLQEEAECLVEVLGGDFAEYCNLMSMDNSRYVCVARRISLDDAERLAEMHLDGFFYEDELERIYPYGQIGGQIIGCLDSDGVGLTGLEAYYDEVLAGSNGVKKYQYGVNGTPIPGTVYEDVPAVDGKDIVVSIDIGMQEYMEDCLVECKTKFDASSSEAVLMDASTGEIFAIASLPFFNPADRSVVEPGSDQVKCIANAFEPGSVFKTVSALAILENGQLTPDDTIDCPVYLEADTFKVSDAHTRGETTYSFREILAVSSNVGISLAVQDYLGFDKFYNKIIAYQLNQPTGVDYPNESAGYLSPFDTWARIQGYNVSFGQGIMVTPLQMTRFYGALRNGGVATTPHFLISLPEDGTQIEYDTATITTDKKSLSTLQSMLVSVVDDGTGYGAAISGYTVAGKTSTAEIASDDGGYKEGVWNLAFCGFLPNSSSELVCFVAAKDVPYLTNVTGTFKAIMSYAIDRYKISPE